MGSLSCWIEEENPFYWLSAFNFATMAQCVVGLPCCKGIPLTCCPQIFFWKAAFLVALGLSCCTGCSILDAKLHIWFCWMSWCSFSACSFLQPVEVPLKASSPPEYQIHLSCSNSFLPMNLQSALQPVIKVINKTLEQCWFQSLWQTPMTSLQLHLVSLMKPLTPAVWPLFHPPYSSLTLFAHQLGCKDHVGNSIHSLAKWKITSALLLHGAFQQMGHTQKCKT